MLHGRRTRPCTFKTAFNMAAHSIRTHVAALVASRPPIQPKPHLWAPPLVGVSIGDAALRQQCVICPTGQEHPEQGNRSGNLACRRPTIRVFRVITLISLSSHPSALRAFRIPRQLRSQCERPQEGGSPPPSIVGGSIGTLAAPKMLHGRRTRPCTFKTAFNIPHSLSRSCGM